MTNNFKKLETEANLPPEVKKETFSNLDSMKLVLDLVDLFFTKASRTFAGTLSSNAKLPQTPKNSEEDA